MLVLFFLKDSRLDKRRKEIEGILGDIPSGLDQISSQLKTLQNSNKTTIQEVTKKWQEEKTRHSQLLGTQNTYTDQSKKLEQELNSNHVSVVYVTNITS